MFCTKIDGVPGEGEKVAAHSPPSLTAFYSAVFEGLKGRLRAIDVGLLYRPFSIAEVFLVVRVLVNGFRCTKSAINASI